MELLKVLKIFLYSVFVILVFTACVTTKHKLVETSKIEKDTIYSKQNNVSLKTINKAINDVVFLPVETGDLKVDSVIKKRFSNFKTYKKSGTNSYKIAYNKKAKGFEIISKIGQTETTLVKKIDSIKKVHNKELLTLKNSTQIKYRIPKWFLILFVISLLAVYILSKFRII